MTMTHDNGSNDNNKMATTATVGMTTKMMMVAMTTKMMKAAKTTASKIKKITNIFFAHSI